MDPDIKDALDEINITLWIIKDTSRYLAAVYKRLEARRDRLVMESEGQQRLEVEDQGEVQ